MTLKDFADIIGQMKIPARYNHWDATKELPPDPYIEYAETYTENFGADDQVYQGVQHIDLFLFTRTKNRAAEQEVERVLNSNKIFWDKTETYLEDEKVYQILYEVSIWLTRSDSD